MTLTADASAMLGTPGRDRPGRAPVEDLERLELGVDARELELHPRLVEHAAAARRRRLAAHAQTSSKQAVGEARRTPA